MHWTTPTLFPTMMVTKHGMGLNKHSRSAVLSHFFQMLLFACNILSALITVLACSAHKQCGVQCSRGLFSFIINICMKHQEKQIITVTFQRPAVIHQDVKFGKMFSHCFVLLKHFTIQNYFNCRFSIKYQGTSTFFRPLWWVEKRSREFCVKLSVAY